MADTATAEVKVEEQKLTEIQQEATTLVAKAKSITISDQASYDVACTILTGQIQPYIQKAEDFFNPNIARAHELHKSLIAQKNQVISPVVAERDRYKGAVLKFELEQRRIEEERQRKAQEEADRLHQEQLLETAIEAEAAGAGEEEKAAILAQPNIAPPPVAAPAYNRAQGVAIKRPWKAEVTDLRELCKAIAEGKAPVSLVEVNQGNLNALARAQQNELKIPGVRSYQDANLAARARK